MKDDNCIFCKLANGEIPTATLYEDDDFRVILDAGPAAKGHALILPKEHYANILEMSDAQAQTLARCLKKLSAMVDELGLSGGFRLVSNKGADACQSVEHLHIHILGGAQLADKMA